MTNPSCWQLNTSNRGKLREFERLFARYHCELQATTRDLKEIESDPVTVVVHKASRMEEKVLVEDTSLEIEGASIGIHVRWLLDHLPDYLGHRAYWIVYLAYRIGNQVFIYQGKICGTIVAPRGQGGFGFDTVFLPAGASETLAQSKPDSYNARALAVEALMQGQLFTTRPTLSKWDGPWQNQG